MRFSTLGLAGFVVAIAVAAGAAGAGEPLAVQPPRGYVLSGTLAMDLGTIDCRITNVDPPVKTFTVWQPSPADIAHFEALLPDFLRKHKVPSDARPLHEYYRQYGGIVKNGKRTICVSFLHERFLRYKPEGFLKDHVFTIEDGGGSVFQIQFNVDTDSFDFVRFGGYA